MTGDRARERSAEKRADAHIHLIKRSQELKAGKYALFTYSLSPFIFVAKKEKTGRKRKRKKEKEKEKEKEKGGLPRERLTTSNAKKDQYERRNMNENDFSAAFDAEDAFASRMDYMRRRRRRRREVEKEEKEEEEKVRRQRASEPRRICFVLDGTQKIIRNSRSHLGQGLVKYCSKFEAFARSANASLEKSHGNPETRKAGRVANPEAQRVEGYGMGQGLGNMNKRTYGRRMYDGVLEYKEGVLF